MLDCSSILPRSADNNYSGLRVPLYFFVAITVGTVARSLIHLADPDGGAQSIATIVLDRFSSGAADTVIAVFALWGLSQLLFGILCCIVLIRYRSLIPLMYLFLVLEYAARLVVGLFKSVEISGTPPGAIGNLVVLPLVAVMLLLSLIPRRKITQS